MPVSRILLDTLLIAAGVAAVAGSCLAHGYRLGQLELVHPAVEVPGRSMGHTCAFVTLINHGSTEERLIGFRIGIARSTDIVTVNTEGEFHHVSNGISIPPGKRINLQKDGWCLLLNGLTATLEADVGYYPATLDFQQAGTVNVDFMVDAPTE